MPVRRIGSIVFKTGIQSDPIWSKCKEAGITDVEVQREMNRFRSIGVEPTVATAAAAALNRRISKNSDRGVVW
jgi:hypothetical protein